MNPEQPQNQAEKPISPAQVPQTPIAPNVTERPRHKKLALTLLIGPTILFILAFICALIASSQVATPQDGSLFGAASPLKQTMNILGFLFGLVGFLTWLPGIIIGIILLTKKK